MRAREVKTDVAAMHNKPIVLTSEFFKQDIITHSIQSAEKYPVTLHGLIIVTDGEQTHDTGGGVHSTTPYPGSDLTIIFTCIKNYGTYLGGLKKKV